MYKVGIIDGPYQGIELRKDLATMYIGRDFQQCALVIDDEKASRLHCSLTVLAGGQLQIDDLNSTNGTLVNGRLLERPTIISSSDRIEIGRVLFRFQVLNISSSVDQPPSGNHTSSRMLSVPQRTLIIGRDPASDIVLDHPMVSRQHARIDYQNGLYYISDLNSTNGTFVNGNRISRITQLTHGALINIGSYSYVFDGSRLEENDQTYGQVKIEVQQLGKLVSIPDGGQKQILSNINLVIEPRQFVAILGGSGAGKSTLTGALTGMRPASYGRILVNNIDFYQNYDAFRSLIGYVPQDDIVHEELTVREVLTFAARLRMPDDSSTSEINATVDSVIQELELSGQRNQLVHNLSGGQRKRVSIGVELLTKPSLFFLDEPTSGLDPGLEKVMMELMRKLANQGRTIILVTHATFNIHLCDKVIFLSPDGHLAFFGSPDEALSYFGCKDFADIYKRINMDGSPEQWAHAYQKSQFFQKYILARMTAPQPATLTSTNLDTLKSSQTHHSALRQWLVLTQRYATMMMRDRRNLMLLILQAIVIPAVILSIFYQNEPLFRASPYTREQLQVEIKASDLAELKSPDLLNQKLKTAGDLNAQETKRRLYQSLCVSLIVLTAIWLGSMNAAREIIKEEAVYKRERMVLLKLAPYIMSKVTVLAAISIIQTFLLVGIMQWGLGLPYFWPNVLAIFIISLSSILMGLTVSALVNNQEKAMSVIPLLLIPQMALSGAVVAASEVKFEFVRWFYYLAISKWGYELVGGAICKINEAFPLDTKMAPFEGPFDMHWWVLIYFIVIFYLITTVVLLKKDRQNG